MVWKIGVLWFSANQVLSGEMAKPFERVFTAGF